MKQQLQLKRKTAQESTSQRKSILKKEQSLTNKPEQEHSVLEFPPQCMNQLLTIPQVAELLGVCRAHVYKLIDQGLPTIHLGRAIRVHTESLHQWVLEQETTK